MHLDPDHQVQLQIPALVKEQENQIHSEQIRAMSASSSVTKKRKVSDAIKHSEANSLSETKISIDFNSNLETIQKFVNDGGNRLDFVSFLLSSGADINKLDTWGRNALEIASKIYHDTSEYQPEIISTLLEQGSNCTNPTDIILHKAASFDHIEVATLFLSRRAADSDTKPISAALRQACKQSNIDMIKLLLKHGATFAEANAVSNGLSCLYMVIGKNATNCLEVVTLILDSGVDWCRESLNPLHPLWRACDTGKGNVQVIKLLLAHGADINARGYRGCTLLIPSCHRDRIEIFKLLVANGADPNLATDDGTTPLIMTAMCGKPNRIKPLLEAGADVTAVDNDGKTVLDYLEGNTTMLELCGRYIDKNRPSLKPILK